MFKEEFEKFTLRETGPFCIVDFNFYQLGQKLDLAQFALDTQVWIDVQQYMPLDTGNLKGQTNVLNTVMLGSGKLYLYPPESDYGHYQHEGVLYVDPITGKGAFYSPKYGFWSRPGVAKVPSERQLTYSQPNAEAHWGMAAYRDHMQEWTEVVRKVLER